MVNENKDFHRPANQNITLLHQSVFFKYWNTKQWAPQKNERLNLFYFL